MIFKGIKYFLTGILFLSSFNYLAQNHKSDSLKKILFNLKEDTNKVNVQNELAWELMYENPDTSIILSGNALSLSEKINWRIGIGKSCGQLGVFYELKTDFPLALKYDFKALAEWERLYLILNSGEDAAILPYRDIIKKGVSKSLGNIGNVYSEQGDYPKAIEFYLKALKIFEELKNKNAVAAILGNIGLIYTYQARKFKTSPLMHDSLIGNALHYYFKALKMKEELKNKMEISITLANIGLLFDEQARKFRKNSPEHDSLDKMALDFCFRALKLDEEIDNKNYMAIHLGVIGGLYHKSEKYDLAEEYLLRSVEISGSIGDLSGIRDGEENLSILYSKTGKYGLALEHYKKHISARDSITNEENVKQQTKTEMNYEFDKKEAATKAEQDKKNAVTKIIIYSISGGLFLILILAIFIFRGYRQKKKANIIITHQKEEVERQKYLVEEKQRDILDSIYYARRIQQSLLPTEIYIERKLNTKKKRYE